MNNNNFLKNVLKVGALFAVGLGVKKLSENREAVKQEFEKAKNDPKGYAKSVQSLAAEKAEQISEQAKQEAEKAKNDPKAYAEGLKGKAVDKAKEVQQDAKAKTQDLKETANKNYEDLKEQGNDTVQQAKAKVDEVKNKKNDKYTTPDADQPQNEKAEKANLANEGGLSANEVKKAQEEAKENGFDVVGKDGEVDENNNVHVVTDDNK